jgi:hypothetical protein
MLPTKQNHKRRGQAVVEAALSLTVFLGLLISAFDLGQMLFFHQALVERVREAVRWASLNPYDGTGDQIANIILYRSVAHPGAGTPAFLNLARDNVRVEYQAPTVADPNEERIRVTIVNYSYEFFSPWIAGVFVHAHPVSAAAPVLYRP